MVQQHVEKLKRLNLKATPKRLAILGLLANESTYCSPEEIWTRLKGSFNRLGLPTVYRNLEELAAGGVITQVLHPNRQLYYYFCDNSEHHHHFICLSCQRVEDVEGCVMEQVQQEMGKRTGGTILSHIIQFNGICRRCSEAA